MAYKWPESVAILDSRYEMLLYDDNLEIYWFKRACIPLEINELPVLSVYD